MNSIELIGENGQPFEWRPGGRSVPAIPRSRFVTRRVFAAAHVVADPVTSTVDWKATMAFRHHLWQLGFGVAEAMDTAQRGMGLDWAMARELIVRTAGEADASDAPAVYGAGTDQLPEGATVTVPAVIDAYREQVRLIESVGGMAILMASRALASIAMSAEDYLEVYGTIISGAEGPVMIHWLGEVFDPALAGYWGSHDPGTALETVLTLAAAHPDRIDGVKISLLDDRLERSMRAGLPAGVRTYTGDDFNFVDMILGDGSGHSDALLGVLDPIAPVAAAAFEALDAGDRERFRTLLDPTIPFARHLFSAPTYHYKTGITFLAFLNGHQNHFRMLGGGEKARSMAHLSRLLVLADDAALLVDPDLALQRMSHLLAMSGFE
ncbi:MAG TPA: dihydrodipicolinate synthase family protein [Acidimicrobiia bacterium]|nr:dihydrodipicolinate synthase family protein [Acidimicrobiia bacterium]